MSVVYSWYGTARQFVLCIISFSFLFKKNLRAALMLFTRVCVWRWLLTAIDDNLFYFSTSSLFPPFHLFHLLKMTGQEVLSFIKTKNKSKKILKKREIIWMNQFFYLSWKGDCCCFRLVGWWLREVGGELLIDANEAVWATDKKIASKGVFNTWQSNILRVDFVSFWTESSLTLPLRVIKHFRKTIFLKKVF